MEKNKRGFTLAEVLISALILGFTLGGLLLLFAKSGMATETFKNTSTATNHARRVLEQMKIYNDRDVIIAEEWDQWGRNNNLTTLDNNDCNTADPLNDNDCEKTEVTYTDTDAVPLEVQVEVMWKNKTVAEDEILTLKVVTLITGR